AVVLVGEDGGVQRRYPAVEGGLVSLEYAHDGCWSGALGHVDRRGADRERKRHAVAQAIGEEQLGGGKHYVAFLDAQHVFGIELGSRLKVAVQVPYPFRRTGRTGGVEPEGAVVG